MKPQTPPPLDADLEALSALVAKHLADWETSDHGTTQGAVELLAALFGRQELARCVAKLGQTKVHLERRMADLD